MKILYVITGLAQGGAERVVCDLADSMVNKGHEVKIAYLTGEVITLPESNSIELVKINLNKAKDLPGSYFRLAKLIKSYNPDIVHSHMVHANILTRLIRILVPMNKLISTAHSNNEGGIIRMISYRITHKLSNLTTNVSKNAVYEFEKKKAVPKMSMECIYNGIDLKKFKYNAEFKRDLLNDLGLSENVKIILSVGSFKEAKDYPNLLKAAKILKDMNKVNFKLIIVGDGELRKVIKDLIIKLDLTENVVLLGRRKDIPNLMSAADLFVLSSKYEGFGLVVAEAMACECIIVATDSGGVAEVIHNKDFLVPINNSEALAEKMNSILDLDEIELELIIKNNLEYVRNNFCLNKIIDKWIDIYYEK